MPKRAVSTMNLAWNSRALGCGGQLVPGHFAELPADVSGVVVGKVGRRRAGEQGRAGGGVEQGVERGHRAVMQVGSGRPDAVQGWGLIADALRFDGIFGAEPGRIIVGDQAVGEAIGPRRVGADFFERNDLVGIVTVRPIRSVASRTVGFEDDASAHGFFGVDRERVFGRLDAAEEGLHVAEDAARGLSDRRSSFRPA